jgi:hypothetical protein
MNHHRAAFTSLALLAVTACAGDDEREDITTAEVTINANTSGSERVARPTDLTIEGAAGGPVEAARLRDDCVGWLPGTPQYLLEITSPEDLALTATTAGDAVLLVVMTDGTVLCNDDTFFQNPQITARFEPGTYPVFVGTWSADAAGLPFEMTVRPGALGPLLGMTPTRRIPGARGTCGMTVPDAGSVTIGSRVVLGAHHPFEGLDAAGGYVRADVWWNDEMWAFVGTTATVTEIALDPIGCPFVRVDVDGGAWGWRVRDLGPPGGAMGPFYERIEPGGGSIGVATVATPPFTGVAIAGVPAQCGMSVPDYGPLVVGMPVVLGAHTAWSGPDGRGEWVASDTWWNEDMWPHVGAPAIITELGGLDPVGCPYVRVDVDGGTWGWRIRDLRPR